MNTPHHLEFFLASSIVELKDERLKLADYINNVVAPILANAGVSVNLFKCEDDPSGNFGGSSQKVFDKELEASDASIFLFKTKAGKKTIREFDLARELQKVKEHGIYMYCFDVPENEKTQELKDFQCRLEREEFYWKTCKDIDSLEALFLLGLLKQLYGEQEVSGESDKEKAIDNRLKQYKDDKERLEQRRERLHQDIDDLLQQIKTTMADEEKNIAVKIAQAIELYQKADNIAVVTAYDKEKYSDLIFGYAQFLDKFGLYKDSVAIWLRQIPLVEELHGKESKEVAISFDSTGKVYSRLCDNRNALFYYSKALAIRKKILGIDHLDTADSYNHIGDLLCEGQSYGMILKHSPNLNKSPMLANTEVLKLHPRVVLKAINFTERLASIIGKFYIPVLLLLNGDYFKCRKGLKYLFKALATRERILGKYHPDTAASYSSIGFAYRKIGNLTKAFEYLSEAMAIDEKTVGIDDYRTSIDYSNIGDLYVNLKQYHLALEYYSKAIKIDEKILGNDHPSVAMDYVNISKVYRHQHRYNDALTYFDMALNILLKRLGPTHPQSQSVQLLIDGTKFEKDLKDTLEALMKDLKSEKKNFWQRLFRK